jgi:hypothetical protein
MTTRIVVLTAWLLLAVGGATYHLTAGPSYEKLDLASRYLTEAEKAAAGEQYAMAVEQYEKALAALPEGKTAAVRKIRVEKAKAQLLANQLPEAHADMKGLVGELTNDPAADPRLLAEARSVMANSNYYMTWLMRLEGLPPETWEPEVDSARQTFKMLAENALARGDAAAAKKNQEDLEASVRLARMDLGELQGLSLPCQCKGCKSKSSKVAKRPAPPPKSDIRSAGGAPPINDTGH